MMTGSAYLLLFVIGLAQFSIHRNRLVSPLIAIPLSIYILFWNAFPFLYSALMRDRTNNVISDPAYQKVVVIQLLAVFFILVMFNVIARIKLHWLPDYRNNAVSAKMILFLLVILLSFELLLFIYSIKTIGMTYLEQIQYTVSDSNKENTVYSFFSGLSLYIVPFAMACFFSGVNALRDSKWIKRLSITIITVHVVVMIISGIRAFILMPIVLIVFFWKSHPSRLTRKAKIFLLLFIIVMMIVAPFISMSLRTIRGMPAYNFTDFYDLFASEIFSNIVEDILLVFDDIYTKFSSFEHGTTLLANEGISRAGWSLITSSLTSPIPRMFYPAKPVPFSSNGEYSGIPYYLAVSHLGFDSESNVVPVPASTISLWELGYLGLLMMMAVNILYLFFINHFMKSESLLFRTMGFAMLSLPTFEFLISPTGLIIKDALRIMIIVLVIWIAVFIVEPGRKIYNHKPPRVE
jgi:oligosaccharide repeat unit polymerase